MRRFWYVALGAVTALVWSLPATAMPQVAADNLWEGNLVWNCVALAAESDEKSAARADLHRILQTAFAAKVQHQTGDFDPAIAGRSEEFWQGVNFGSAMDFVITDLFARLPIDGSPSFISAEAARLYDEKGCATLGR